MRLILALFYVALVLPGLANGGETTTDPRLSGGATTVMATGLAAFSQPLANASLLRREDFHTGGAFFQQPWVIAPSSTTARDGVGPLFKANSCISCHVQSGRGHPPLTDQENFLSTLVKLSIPAMTPEQHTLQQQRGVIPEPTYGDHLQPYGIGGLPGEGTPHLSYTEIHGQFKDGERYTLLKPNLRIDQPHYGALAPDTQFSVRTAPPLLGMGLLEAIPETAILANADPDDKDGDGISGRPNHVWDIAQQKTVLGRFSWKANQPSIHQQTADAFRNDIGITSPLFPEQPCTTQQTDCHQLPEGGKPEIPSGLLEKVTFHVAFHAVPARRGVTDAPVLQGETLFQQAGCAACHTPHFKTGNKLGFDELTNQAISPYSDLLLHDMGEGLADNRPEFLASGREWRTAPLWGIGLTQTVTGHTRFLHDGRARSLLEAILWHGGEAETTKQKVLAMTKTERDALLHFLNSL